MNHFEKLPSQENEISSPIKKIRQKLEREAKDFKLHEIAMSIVELLDKNGGSYSERYILADGNLINKTERSDGSPPYLAVLLAEKKATPLKSF